MLDPFEDETPSPSFDGDIFLCPGVNALTST